MYAIMMYKLKLRRRQMENPFTLNALIYGEVRTTTFADFDAAKEGFDKRRRSPAFAHIEVVDERTGEVVLEDDRTNDLQRELAWAAAQ